MKYLLLIHHGDTPTPSDPEAWAKFPEEERQAVYRDYQALSSTPGVTLWQAEFNDLKARRIGTTPAFPTTAVGDGLVLKNDAASAAAINLRGTLAYSQG